ncbi:MAG TPA: STAS domain-containing protein [Candidatus Omnitrophota bacterium]|nr:STAS domain-containing protein [Candidatus Omnitrophota bacterium]
MMYTIQSQPKSVSVVCLKGSPNVYELDELKSTLNSILNKVRHKNKLILDFSQLINMDELALGVFVAFSKNYRAGGGELRLAGLNRTVRNLFDYAQLSKVYEICDSAADAQRSFIEKR